MRRWLARWTAPLVALAAVAVAGYLAWSLWSGLAPEGGSEVRVTEPSLSAEAQAGRAAYVRRCVQCHGPHGAGTTAGPPLVHPVYRPAHHADAAFALAVRRGVPAHHWRFGDMPPQPDVGADEIGAITQYVRELQRANGIE
jgi:mono/diheme cytochrome c family protein